MTISNVKTKRVLFVGEASHHEFRDALAWLSEYCELFTVPTITAARGQLTQLVVPPEAIVLAAAHPGAFCQSDVEALHRLAPLARIIGLMGGWCEGELRTGEPWRGVARVYWHQFVSRLASEFLGGQGAGRLAVPRTLTDMERSLLAAKPPRVERPGLVVIRTNSLDAYGALADTCRPLGHATVWAAPRQRVIASTVVAGIWDSLAALAPEQAELEQFAHQLRPAPTLALVGFPREQDHQAALAAGASAVVTKPFLLDELWSTLSRVTSSVDLPARPVSAA